MLRFWVIYHFNIFPSQNRFQARGKNIALQLNEKSSLFFENKIWMLKFEKGSKSVVLDIDEGEERFTWFRYVQYPRKYKRLMISVQ